MSIAPLVVPLELGPMENFVYLLACPTTRVAAIVDAGWEPEAILAEAERRELTIESILLTHTHFDHVGALGELAKQLEVPTYVHAAEAKAVRQAAAELVEVADGDEIQVGEMTARTVHTPGHSPGGVTYVVGNAAFTGDVLFVGFCGRCDLNGSDCNALWDSMHNRLLTLPDETVVYSGHNYGETPTSTIAHERETNPYLQYATPEAFAHRMLTGAE